MLNATVGVQRVIGRLRRPRAIEPIRAPADQPSPGPSRSAARQRARGHAATRPHRRSSCPRPASVAPPDGRPCPPCPLRQLVLHLGHERSVAIAVAGIVLGASVLSVGQRPLRRRYRRPGRRRPGRPASRSAAASATTAAVASRRPTPPIRSRRPSPASARGPQRQRPSPHRRHRRQRPGGRRGIAEREAQDRRRGPVPRRRHAAQAGRRRHRRRRRQSDLVRTLQGQVRRHAGRHRRQATTSR